MRPFAYAQVQTPQDALTALAASPRGAYLAGGTNLIDLMKDIEIPNGVAAVGFRTGDIPGLVEGTMKQQRLLATCPRPVSAEDIAAIFAKSIQNW